MTDQPITVTEALRALEREIKVCDKATPEEWFTDSRGYRIFAGKRDERIDRVVAGTGWNAAHRVQQTIDDGIFIVHARNGYRAALEYLLWKVGTEGEEPIDPIYDCTFYAAVAPIVSRFREEDKR